MEERQMFSADPPQLLPLLLLTHGWALNTARREIPVQRALRRKPWSKETTRFGWQQLLATKKNKQTNPRCFKITWRRDQRNKNSASKQWFNTTQCIIHCAQITRWSPAPSASNWEQRAAAPAFCIPRWSIYPQGALVQAADMLVHEGNGCCHLFRPQTNGWAWLAKKLKEETLKIWIIKYKKRHFIYATRAGKTFFWGKGI